MFLAACTVHTVTIVVVRAALVSPRARGVRFLFLCCARACLASDHTRLRTAQHRHIHFTCARALAHVLKYTFRVDEFVYMCVCVWLCALVFCGHHINIPAPTTTNTRLDTQSSIPRTRRPVNLASIWRTRATRHSTNSAMCERSKRTHNNMLPGGVECVRFMLVAALV